VSARLSLDVWYDGHPAPVGRLDALDSNALAFCYTPEFAATGQSISLSLPAGTEPVGDQLTRAFFDNLLPENDQMQRIIDREGLDRADIVDILGHVGGDCPGAISCLPLGAPPIKVPGSLAEDYRPLAPDELALIVQRLADRQPLPDDIVDPSPVAGVQRKLAITLLPDGRFALPAEGRKVPTTHILKVPRRAEGADALLEDAACTLARACGFDVSHSRHMPVEGVDTLLIERFDRVIVDDTVYRLHQEDFAQALGLPARLKYERHGTEARRFDTAAVRSVLDRLAHPGQARETFLLATLFNLAIGNTDNHAKNFGILYGLRGERLLAPLYDMLPIRLHDRYTHELAYRLGGAAHFDEMTREQMTDLFAEFGLERGRARRFIEGPVRAMFTTIEQRAPLLREIGQRFFDDLIGRELTRLAELLDLDVDIRERDYFAPAGSGGGWAMGS
jgi:serine/threonine-protein kinase HipA